MTFVLVPVSMSRSLSDGPWQVLALAKDAIIDARRAQMGMETLAQARANYIGPLPRIEFGIVARTHVGDSNREVFLQCP